MNDPNLSPTSLTRSETVPALRHEPEAPENAPTNPRGTWGRFALICLPYFWLSVFFLIPFVIVARISLSEAAVAIPPYLPVIEWEQGLIGLWEAAQRWSFENYIWLIEDDLYWKAYISSLQIAFISTFLTLLIGFPIAYGMARAPRVWQPTLIMMVILPFWTSFLIRVYAWIGILKIDGLLNQALAFIGMIDEPLVILNTSIAVYIGIIYSYLPFMILPLYSSLEKLDTTLIEAAQDLGCPPLRTFWRVTIPLALPGMVAGCFLVFIPAVGEFIIPDLLGGSSTLMIGKTLWVEFFSNRDWPVSSAVATVLLVLLIVPILMFQRHETRRNEGDT
ncbi:Putrescine transport system permease protein PotH [Pseudovibrio axinellae]|uniref:Putrescine transport system permease protein PotH n=1 Tax=Pseudovibrio axinellae TaxID=989403 RepID=A0A165U255_9HYPH|nr:ABC transporter permease subunit [Pseudovibrio axinellae]KZL09474.1 Putrescine transport system permease protein PotH [Pseudovibrio axinellae]SEQ63744.1 putrescine transport system permease protein [Pseudovibrio axinellae]